MHVVVIGAGVAGVAAAWAAAEHGAQVTLIDGGVSASELSGGAVDDVPWEELERAEQASGEQLHANALSADAASFAQALGLWNMVATGERFARVVTAAGRMRLTRGHDHGLLNLQLLPAGSQLLLPRVPRAEWDADSLARCLNEAPYAVQRNLRFKAAEASLLRHIGDDRIGAVGLASLYEDDYPWLRDRLRELLAEHPETTALLCGPWLGAKQTFASALAADLGVAVGEVLMGLDGPHVLRFRHARRQLMTQLNVNQLRARVAALGTSSNSATAGQPRVILESGEDIISEKVVLAVGGLSSGGLLYEPPYTHPGMAFPPAGTQTFRLSLDAPVTLQAHGRPLRVTSSMHGPDLDANAWPKDADPGLLEAVGIRCSDVRLSRDSFAAGDIIADRQRTIIAAVESGVRAGRGAALDAVLD